MLDTKVTDWTSDRLGPKSETNYRSLRLSFVVFAVAASIVWLLLFDVYKSLPYVQNGAAAVGQIKWSAAQSSELFAPADRIRVLAFGNSQILAGFRPAAFDAAAGADVAAYNLSIPGDDKFLDLLEAALSNGNVPTHVFLQFLPQSPDESVLALLRDNNRIVKWLFPFRNFVRDAVIFLFESREGGGLVAQYKSNAAQVRQIVADRGYYFIKSESHYPGDRLPDDYALPTDRPGEVLKRTIDPSDPGFARLMRLADRYDFQIVVVPVAFRRGAYAEPPDVDSDATAAMKPYPRVHVIGPAYWVYPVSQFSDPIHLNMRGADRYSKDLARSFADWLGSRR
jgi:hypothetical protein